jgi:protein-S-isoprenylcysteine O-methyltransferase Ste14
MMVAGYALFYSVLRANSWAFRVIEVQEGQSVIYFAAPLVLGSWWSMIPVAVYPVLLALRVRNEEKILVEGLPGYDEYRKKVRWRILPGIW